jgi:hypothetical protein
MTGQDASAAMTIVKGVKYLVDCLKEAATQVVTYLLSSPFSTSGI